MTYFTPKYSPKYPPKYPVVAVVAMAKNRVIGDGKQLLWHLPQDLKRVKQITLGKPLIMGRRTFDSIGSPLPGRANIVLTQNKNWHATGVMTAHSPDQAVQLASDWIESDHTRHPEIIIFGGEAIYRLFMPYLTGIEATEIDRDYIGKTAFPETTSDDWRQIARQDFPPTRKTPGFSYIRYARPATQTTAPTIAQATAPVIA